MDQGSTACLPMQITHTQLLEGLVPFRLVSWTSACWLQDLSQVPTLTFTPAPSPLGFLAWLPPPLTPMAPSWPQGLHPRCCGCVDPWCPSLPRVCEVGQGTGKHTANRVKDYRNEHIPHHSWHPCPFNVSEQHLPLKGGVYFPSL